MVKVNRILSDPVCSYPNSDAFDARGLENSEIKTRKDAAATHLSSLLWLMHRRDSGGHRRSVETLILFSLPFNFQCCSHLPVRAQMTSVNVETPGG